MIDNKHKIAVLNVCKKGQTLKTIFYITAVSFLLLNCSDDQDENPPNISGTYQIVSILSDSERDLNNDGVKSSNILREIADPHHTIDNQLTSLYNFTATSQFSNIDNATKTISLVLPAQYIDATTNGDVFLSRYTNDVLLYSYESVKTSGQVNFANTQRVEDIESMKQLNDGSITIIMNRKLFDFIDQVWTSNQLTIALEKVE